VTQVFDVAVVGGGTAGCVVAARLSEDPRVRVLLLEEGPDPQPVPGIIGDVKRQGQLVLESPYVRMYDVERDDGSGFPLLSGRVMGGGSAINNAVVVRPMRVDFDTWAAIGGPDWSYESLLPVMRAIEDDPEFAGDPLHGVGGPLRLERSFHLDDPADPPVRALIRAAVDLGLPECPDLNVPEPFGICASPYNVHRGTRQSTAVAYLDPARGRPNLSIRADTQVARLVMDGGRVTGVELAGEHAGETIAAGQVVLCAGTYHSPQLLMLSGIGPEAELVRLGIPLRHRLDGVGENHRDHAVVYVTFQGTSELHEDHVIPKVRLIARSRPALPVPDLHVFMRPSVRVPGLPPLLPVSLHLLEHRSAGRVTLASTDPADLPVVDAGMLRSELDVQALVDGIGLVERLAGHRELARFYGPIVTPPASEDRERHVRTSYETYHHGVGTCALGPGDDPRAVVDPQLRVHGLDGLWIADASVLPTVPHANTNLAAILVGEVAARTIVGSGSAARASA
jgi:choline dehydrogenase